MKAHADPAFLINGLTPDSSFSVSGMAPPFAVLYQFDLDPFLASAALNVYLGRVFITLSLIP